MLAEEMVPSRNPLIPTPHMAIDSDGEAEIRAVWKISF